MLVVTANWSWTDGSLVPNRPGRGSAWLRDVHRAVLRAGFRRDGRYRPIEAVDIVFAGDTFDALVSRRWTDRLRPWHGGPQAAAMRDQTLVEAARRGRRLLAGLARWAREGMALPPADQRGRPLPHATTRAEVRVTLLAGDRDRWLELTADVAARHHCRVGHIWADDGSIIRHGAEFDPCWCGADAAIAGGGDQPLDWRAATQPRLPAGLAEMRSRPPFLGESVVVDLVARFAATARDRRLASPAVLRLAGRLTTATLLEIPAHLAGWLAARHQGDGLTAAQRQRIESEWRRAVAAWHREARRLPPVCDIEACPVDWLAGWFERPATAAAPADVAARFASRPPRADRQAVRLLLGHVGRRARAAPGVHWPRDRVVGLANECGVVEVPPTAVRTGQVWGWLPAAAPALPGRQTAAAAVATMLSDGSAEDAAAHAAA
jgi:hypothetical protein